MNKPIFVDRVTHVPAEWANLLSDLAFDVFKQARTKSQAINALGIGTLGLQAANKVQIAGGSINNVSIGFAVPMQARFTVASMTAEPVSYDHLTNKRYVDNRLAQLDSSVLHLSGGTLSGPILLYGMPVDPREAASKEYVDQRIAANSSTVSSGSPFASDILVNGLTVGKGSTTTAWVENTAVGTSALLLNTEGYNNVAIGGRSLRSNTGGSNNTAVGHESLADNVYGTDNTAIGAWALRYNTEGSENIAIGSQTLVANTTGNRNHAIGNGVLFRNTTGTANIGLGNGTLFANTLGSRNVAIGEAALRQNTTGNNSVAIGNNALSSSTIGVANVGVGYGAGSAITTGSRNVVIGGNSGSSIAALDNQIILSDGQGNIRATVDETGTTNVVGSLKVNGVAVNTTQPFTWDTQTSNYTLALADAGNGVAINSADASSITVPEDASVNFPIGTSLRIATDGLGPVGISGDAGVIVRYPSGLTNVLRGQYSLATLVKRAANTWYLAGDLAGAV